MNIFHPHASVQPCAQLAAPPQIGLKLHIFIFLMLPHEPFSKRKLLSFLHSQLSLLPSLFKQLLFFCSIMKKSQNLNSLLKKSQFGVEEEKVNSAIVSLVNNSS